MRSFRFVSLILLVSLLSLFYNLGFSKPDSDPTSSMANLGGIRDMPAQNSVEAEELARFAVEEHNKKANALLEFGRLVKAKDQVVAGTMYHLTLEAIDAGKKKTYEAKVWVKPWMNFKELQEFKQVGDSSTSV